MPSKKDVSNNYSEGLEIVKAEYESTFARFKEIDNKFNMLLVFAAGEIAAFGATYSSLNDNIVFRWIYLIVFFIFLSVAVIFNLVGLLTKKLKLMNTSDMLQFVELDSDKFNENYINWYNESIDSIDKQIDKKTLLFDISLILLIVSFITFCGGMIVNLFIITQI